MEFLIFLSIVFFILVVWASLIASFFRVLAVTDDGLSLKSLLGRRLFLAWADVEPPAKQNSAPFFSYLQLRRRHVGFLSLNRNVGVLLPKEDRDTLVRQVGRHIAILIVKSSRDLL